MITKTRNNLLLPFTLETTSFINILKCVLNYENTKAPIVIGANSQRIELHASIQLKVIIMATNQTVKDFYLFPLPSNAKENKKTLSQKQRKSGLIV